MSCVTSAAIRYGVPSVNLAHDVPCCLQAELAEAEAEVAAPDDDEEADFVYNPLKLPLGWDGKPIPYWLYKLHGLNQEFKCEICGNQSYWGRCGGRGLCGAADFKVLPAV